MLTGDKYDLFRPVCNRPEKKKTDRRGSGVWELGVCGGAGERGVREGGDPIARDWLRPWWSQCAQRCRRCWSNFTACPPHLPSHFHSLTTCLSTSPLSPFPSLFLSLSPIIFDLSFSLSLVFPLPLSSSTQERLRGQEPPGSLEQQG